MVCCSASGTLEVDQQYPATLSVPCSAQDGVAAVLMPDMHLSGSLPGASAWTSLASTLQVLDLSGEWTDSCICCFAVHLCAY